MLPKTIIAAIDFSTASAAVLETAFALAECFSAQVHLVHAFSLSEVSESALRTANAMHDARALAERELRKLAEPRIQSGRVGQLIVREGDPATVLVKVSEHQHADLLIVDTHHRGLQRFAQGSVAERVIREAPCAVLVLRERPHAAE